MAQGSLFGRLKNLWTGFIGLWVSNAERKHPEIAYENAVQNMTSKYVQLKEATAAIIRRREDITARLEQERQALQGAVRDLDAAVAGNDDDLALALIQKKQALEAEVQGLTEELSQAKQDAEDAKSSLMSVKSEIERLKGEKDRMLAKMRSAQARIKIQDQIEGVSVDADVQALESVREGIRNTVAQANLSRELNDADLDTRLKKLRESSSTRNAQEELERLKAARAQKSEQTTKSM